MLLVVLAAPGCGIPLATKKNGLTGQVGWGSESPPTESFGYQEGPRALALEARYARRLYQDEDVGVFLEVPISAIPEARSFFADADLPDTYSTIAITPGIFLKMHRRFSLSVGAGGGWIRFKESDRFASGAPNPHPLTTSTGTADLMTSFDYQLVPRFEVGVHVRAFFAKPRFSSVTNSEPDVVRFMGGFAATVNF